MKANTAAIVLRALRSRIEISQIFTTGMHEVYALWAAYEASDQNPEFLRLLQLSLNIMAASLNGPAAAGVGKEECELIRTGYKVLDTKGTTEYKFPELDKLGKMIQEKLTPKSETPTAAQDPAKLPNTDKFVTMMENLMKTDPSQMN